MPRGERLIGVLAGGSDSRLMTASLQMRTVLIYWGIWTQSPTGRVALDPGYISLSALSPGCRGVDRERGLRI